MKKAIYLPTFETAPAANRLLICRPNQTLPPTEAHPKKDIIERRQAIAKALVSIPLVMPEEDPQMSPLASSGSGGEAWHNLSQYTSRWIYQHITKVNDNLMSESGHPIELNELRDHLDSSTGAAREGIVTIAAFLEVVAKLSANNDYANPSQAIAQKAMASKGFIIEWAGLDSQVDRPLAYSLAECPKPTKETEVFIDLHFNPKWFKDENGRVKLDPALASNLRSYQKMSQSTSPYGYSEPEIVARDKHPSVEQTSSDLFGCPSMPIIPKIYDFMVATASTDKLFEKTYNEERWQRGYNYSPETLDTTVNSCKIELELERL